MNPTHLKRQAMPPPFENRDTYLAKAGLHDAKICQVLSASLNGTDPWLTLVLGSGCSQSEGQAVDALVEAVSRIEKTSEQGEAQQPIDGIPLADVVADFTLDLIRDRLHLADRPQRVQPGASSREPAPLWLVELVLVAATLSRLYFESKTGGFYAPRRSLHDDEVRLSRARSRRWDHLDNSYGQRCRTVVASLLDRLRRNPGEVEIPEPARETIANILSKVRDGLTRDLSTNQMTIRAANVHGLAEIVWSCLVDLSESRVYPGWTDLLLDLSYYDDPQVGQVGLPAFKDFQAAQKPVGDRYSDIARASWANKKSEPEIYAAAAALLNRQHEYLRTFRPSEGARPPYAVVYSTSFDLELELALLRDGRPFSVALPLHVLASSPSVVFTVWCLLRVQPDGDDSDIDLILKPTESQWQLQTDEAKSWLWDGPVVVRLAGCPSIPLPDLRRWEIMRRQVSSCLDAQFNELAARRRDRKDWESPEQARNSIESSLSMAHALIMNEYDALLHSSIDQGDRAAPHGLLPDFAWDEKRWSRFWLLLGVQIQDAAFRNRVASLIATLPARGRILPSHEFPPRRFGLAVNLYSTALEHELISWSGFDMVRAKVSDFVPDITHYRDHLKTGAEFGERCNV